MVTGDHPATASAIATRIGLAAEGEPVMTGEELRGLSEEVRAQAVLDTRVYARVSPEQKFDIVKALQRHGECIAMTGDCVNDVPSGGCRCLSCRSRSFGSIS